MDYSQWDTEFGLTPTHIQPGDLPDGTYEATVSKVSVFTDPEGNDYLVFDIILSNCALAGSSVYKRTPLPSDGRASEVNSQRIKFLKKDLDALGIREKTLTASLNAACNAKEIPCQLACQTSKGYQNFYLRRRASRNTR